MVKEAEVVTISCVNYSSVWGDKAANLRKMGNIVEKAADQGSNIVAFPELALSGYECTENCQMHAEQAEMVPGPSTEAMADLSAKKDVYVVFGMPERERSGKGKLYISTAIVGPEGILGTYRKTHPASIPPYREHLCFQPGDSLPVFETKYGKIGIQICADFWYFGEQTRILALKGARILINTSASLVGPGKPYFIVQQSGARATENGIFVATANMTGVEKSAGFCGHSVIVGPLPPRRSHIYAEAGESEEVITATLNLKQLKWFHDTHVYSDVYSPAYVSFLKREFEKLDQPESGR